MWKVNLWNAILYFQDHVAKYKLEIYFSRFFLSFFSTDARAAHGGWQMGGVGCGDGSKKKDEIKHSKQEKNLRKFRE